MYAVTIRIGSGFNIRELSVPMTENNAVNLKTQLELSPLCGTGEMFVSIKPLAEKK